MHSLKQVFRLVTSSLYTLLFSRKFLIFLTVAFIFSSYTFGGLNDIAAFYSMKVSAYVFPFFVSNPSIMLILGTLAIYFFSDLPFTEQSPYFVLIRTNRKLYYVSKILYTFVASAIFTATFVLFSILSILPHADFTNQWGKIIHTLSSDLMRVLEQTHSKIGFGVNPFVLNKFTPLKAMGYSFLLMVLAIFFLGIVMMFASVILSKTASYIASGFFVCLSYFSVFLGYITWGNFLNFISPFSWITLNRLDINQSGLAPRPLHAILVLLCSTALMEIISFVKFINTDLKL